MEKCKEAVSRLERRGVRPTANRVLVLEAILAASQDVSLADIEARLGTVDRSSVFRTLCLFVKHHLVHAIDDGSGSVKYEACDSRGDCSVSDMHTHFYCEVCHRTFCLKTNRRACGGSACRFRHPFDKLHRQGRLRQMFRSRAFGRMIPSL